MHPQQQEQNLALKKLLLLRKRRTSDQLQHGERPDMCRKINFCQHILEYDCLKQGIYPYHQGKEKFSAFWITDHEECNHPHEKTQQISCIQVQQRAITDEQRCYETLPDVKMRFVAASVWCRRSSGKIFADENFLVRLCSCVPAPMWCA